MKMNVSFDKAAFKKSMNDINKQVSRGMRKAVADVTAATLKESRAQMSEMIYNKPIPTTKSGKPAWKRTSNLLRQERSYMKKPLEGVIDNKAPYANFRHDLDTPSPIDGVTRSAPWREKTVEVMESKAQRIADKAMKSELRD